MLDIIRSLCWKEVEEAEEASNNFKYAKIERFTTMTVPEEQVMTFIIDFFLRRAESPKFDSVLTHFESVSNAEATVLLEDAATATPYFKESFRERVEKEVEAQSVKKFSEVCEQAVKIARKEGVVVNRQTLEGLDQALEFIFSEAKKAPGEDLSSVKASMSANEAALSAIYQERKQNPEKVYGTRTGYGLFDTATAGIRRKQLYLHAGYGGHLKSTMMFNMMLNAAVDGAWNVLLFTSEMPAVDVQQILIAIHSGHPQFQSVGKPLPSFNLLLGHLTDEQEKFYEDVKHDLLTNKNYGSLRVVDSSEFTTFGSIMQRSIRENVEEEVDVLWIDYLTRLPLDAKYSRMDTVMARNETIADAKRFAMAFDGGKGIPVCSPFQVNREGFKRAKQNGGRLDKTSLAQYNAAEREADIITYIFYDSEEADTFEPKIGILKSRYGETKKDPVGIYIDPDSRRMYDLTAGLQMNQPIQAGDAVVL